MLCFLAKHLTLIVFLSTQVYNWEPANCLGTTLQNAGRLPAMDKHPIQGCFLLQKPETSVSSDRPLTCLILIGIVGIVSKETGVASVGN